MPNKIRKITNDASSIKSAPFGELSARVSFLCDVPLFPGESELVLYELIRQLVTERKAIALDDSNRVVLPVAAFSALQFVTFSMLMMILWPSR